LITRSKMEHNPRLLITLEHTDGNLFIGELDKYIKMQAGLKDEQIRSIADFKLDLSPLREVINTMGANKPTEFMKKDPRLEIIGW